MTPNECQLDSLKSMTLGNADTRFDSLVIKYTIKHSLSSFVKRHLSPDHVQTLRRYVTATRNFSFRPRGESSSYTRPATSLQTGHLKAGDQVRVRSLEEIKATLDSNGKTKGCYFMPSMKPYCGSVQRVLKSVERFCDEGEMQAKKCKGIVLLEGLMCQGNEKTGRCDRSCFYFWREEWLEK
jgi:hypothetical protein